MDLANPAVVMGRPARGRRRLPSPNGARGHPPTRPGTSGRTRRAGPLGPASRRDPAGAARPATTKETAEGHGDVAIAFPNGLGRVIPRPGGRAAPRVAPVRSGRPPGAGDP